MNKVWPKKVTAVLVVSVTLAFAGTAAATPTQARQITRLTAQVHRQQAAITRRNATITRLTNDLGTTQALLATANAAIINLTAARDQLQAALAGSVTDQVGAMTAVQAWSLVPAIAARLRTSCWYDTSYYSSSGYVSWSLTYTGICL